MRKYLIQISSLCLLSIVSYGQQLPLHYGLDGNAFMWNPALAGKFDYRSVGIAYNQPWSGFEGAPENLQVFGETPVFDRKSSIGTGIEGEQSNTYNRVSLTTAFNYKLRFGYRGRRQLAIGLAIRYERMDVFIRNPLVNNHDDPLIGLNQNVYNQLNAGLGLFFASERKYFERSLFFAGAALYPAIPGGLNNEKPTYLPAIHGNTQAGANIKLNREWFFEPILWVDFNEAFQVYPQLSLKIERDQSFWVRLHATTNSGALNLGYMVFFNRTTELRIGVSARFWYGAIRDYNGLGSDGDIVLRNQLEDSLY
jgi:type IX secretion system PorP/SprF family membrane protein